MSIWVVKDHYKGKVYLRTNDKQKAVNYANYYNDRKKVPFTKYTISLGCSIFKNETWVDINSQFGVRKPFDLFPTKYDSPFVKKRLKKHYDRMHKLYLKRKYELVLKLCRKYHLWPYNEKDGHKLCGFDW